MKKVIFKTLKVKNFLSIGKTPITVDFSKGLNIITGVNRDLMDRQNGTGKSTILDAFYFAIFGETTRELKKEFIVNNITNESAEASLEFSVDDKEFKIVRSIKPSKCFLFEDGIDVSRDSMANTTEYVLNLLNLSPEIFSNCVGLSINTTIPFMAQKKIDKRKFIEGIFNLDVFSKMNSSLKEEYNQAKKDIEGLSLKYKETENFVKIIEEQNKKNLEERKNREVIVVENIKTYKQQIEELDKKIKKYEISDNKKTEDKIDKLKIKNENNREGLLTHNKQSTELLTKVKILKEGLSKIGTDKDECPSCLRPITTKDFEHIEEKKTGIQSNIDNISKENLTIEEKIKTIQKDIQLVEKATNLLKDAINKNNLQLQQKKNDEEKLEYIKTQLSKEEKIFQKLQKFENEENKNVEELNKKLSNYGKELDGKKEEFKVLENVKFVLSEEGVKGYVVKKILKLFNSKIAFYLKKLNSNASIVFDQYFEEEIKNERGVPTMYFNYSGAERKAIDLAIMFTFIDMLKLQTNVYYNVQFYDELLDTSLDSTGVENVVELLNEFVEKYSYGIYVISHRKECGNLANGEVVFLEKKNGITERITPDYT